MARQRWRTLSVEAKRGSVLSVFDVQGADGISRANADTNITAVRDRHQRRAVTLIIKIDMAASARAEVQVVASSLPNRAVQISR